MPGGTGVRVLGIDGGDASPPAGALPLAVFRDRRRTGADGCGSSDCCAGKCAASAMGCPAAGQAAGAAPGVAMKNCCCHWPPGRAGACHRPCGCGRPSGRKGCSARGVPTKGIAVIGCPASRCMPGGTAMGMAVNARPVPSSSAMPFAVCTTVMPACPHVCGASGVCNGSNWESSKPLASLGGSRCGCRDGPASSEAKSLAAALPSMRCRLWAWSPPSSSRPSRTWKATTSPTSKPPTSSALTRTSRPWVRALASEDRMKPQRRS
mmetsp:Transcript_48790/g.141335  ORF Transcript_48790/g.141335 Transcript_48790/m.141335 type:complete len:265 (-) Transcript_48790:171-965(-)